jgi:hypothetical protein
VLAFFGATHRITSRKALMFPRKTEMHPSVNPEINNLLTFDTRLTLLTFSSSVPVLSSVVFFPVSVSVPVCVCVLVSICVLVHVCFVFPHILSVGLLFSEDYLL